MSEISTIFKGNDTLIELNGLQNELTGAFLNAATVTVTLVDSTGTNVVGATFPLTMTYVANSDGIYRATLPYGLTLLDNTKYKANISANGGLGLVGAWSADVVCKTRK